MYEIELKAHVEDRREVARTLDSFAEYIGALTKRDTYYRLPLACVPTGTEAASSKRADAKAHSENTEVQTHIGCRIRKTVYEKTGETKITFTYKRKELRKDADGIAIEVNDEKECTLSETDAIESFIKDSGGGISHIKEKIIKVTKLVAYIRRIFLFISSVLNSFNFFPIVGFCTTFPKYEAAPPN